MVSSLRHRKTLVHVCISPFIPMLQASLHLLESRYIVADLVGFHRPALEVLHVFVILFFPGFYGQKNKQTKKQNWILHIVSSEQNYQVTPSRLELSEISITHISRQTLTGSGR